MMSKDLGRLFVSNSEELIKLGRALDKRYQKIKVAQISSEKVSVVVTEHNLNYDMTCGDYYLMLAITAQVRAGLHDGQIIVNPVEAPQDIVSCSKETPVNNGLPDGLKIGSFALLHMYQLLQTILVLVLEMSQLFRRLIQVSKLEHFDILRQVENQVSALVGKTDEMRGELQGARDALKTLNE